LKFAVAHVKHPTLLFVYGISFCILLISATTCNGSVYGQISRLPTSSSNVTGATANKLPPVPSASRLLSPSSPIAHSVRITSPVNGQKVPIGNLTISGTSKDNINSNCYVNVIVNDVKPYQNASAIGPGGLNDYSNWTFNLTPKYTTLKEGINNKITAKFSCSSNPTLASFYSVNVTGVPRAAKEGGGLQNKTASTAAITNTNATGTS
jgi:hypothetical protein